MENQLAIAFHTAMYIKDQVPKELAQSGRIRLTPQLTRDGKAEILVRCSTPESLLGMAEQFGNKVDTLTAAGKFEPVKLRYYNMK